tara:strand:- start:803 stop:1378 length:576 start_codon:yes stop_codon:yes gene_type:complete
MKQYIFLSFLSMILATSCSTILVNTTSREGIQENPARRTPGAVVEDQSIETIVAVNLKADSLAFRESRFNVVSHNGVVLLVGQIENDSMKQKATEIISKASSKIKRIHNELEITDRKGILSRGNDTWIATKVRALMLANEEISANQVKVVVENGAVYLMGILTESEGDIAANVARNVVGVSKVIKVFEYIT